MRENFDRAFSFMLKYEGGYSDNPKDPGGPTNLGVTITTLSHELGRRATRTEMRNLTPAAVQPIYRKKYWNVVGADALPAGVDLLAFDIAVNSGPGRALRFLDKTDRQAPADRIESLHALRMSFWRGLSTWKYFGRGWARRETACLALARQMVSGS
jgi:lysozyme family protein